MHLRVSLSLVFSCPECGYIEIYDAQKTPEWATAGEIDLTDLDKARQFEKMAFENPRIALWTAHWIRDAPRRKVINGARAGRDSHFW